LDILDRLKPGALDMDTRCLLAGMIAGRLMNEREAVEITESLRQWTPSGSET
jgi:hypothetical protein